MLSSSWRQPNDVIPFPCWQLKLETPAKDCFVLSSSMVSFWSLNMVGLLYQPKSPSLDSFLLLYSQQQLPITSRVYLSLSSNLLHQEWLWNLSQPQKKLRPGSRVLAQCSCVDSLSSSEADTGMLFSFFGELGIDEKETEALLVKNSAIAVSSLELVRARVHSLRSVGLDDLEISLLITKRPNVVTSEEVDRFISFLLGDLEGTVETSQLERLFSSTEPRFLTGFDRKVGLLLEQGVPREKIAHILNNVNLSKALCVKPVEELDRTIAFLSHFGGIDLIVKRPTLLNYDLDSQLIPRVGFFRKLSGGDDAAVGVVLGKLPAVLNYTVKHFEGHLKFFRSFAGLNDEEIFKLVLVYPNVFSASRDRKMLSRLAFLKECGLSSEEIYKFLIRAPLFLSLSFKDNIAHKLVLLLKIGYKHRTKDLAVAMGSVTRTSCQNMHKVVGVFLSYGLSCDDILAMSTRHPPVLQYNHSSLEKKMEYLVDEMGRDIGELLAFPAFLGYKLDDRIKARYESRRETCGEEMSINKLLTVSSERFSRRKKSQVRAVEEERTFEG